MEKIKIKFLKVGRWGDEPSKPIFSVEANEIVSVTPRLAKIATNAGKAEFVVEDTEKSKTGPKKKAEREGETGPKKKAETRFKKQSERY